MSNTDLKMENKHTVSFDMSLRDFFLFKLSVVIIELEKEDEKERLKVLAIKSFLEKHLKTLEVKGDYPGA